MPDQEHQAPLLYLIAGPTRTGKSITAQRFNESTGISIVSTDDLVRMFQVGAPELGISHQTGWRDRAQKLAPFIDGLAEVRMGRELPLLIEGELLPGLLEELIGNYQPFVRACCFGNISTTVAAKTAAIRSYSESSDDWTRHLTDDRLLEFVQRILADSLEFRTAAERLAIPFFDMSPNFEASVGLALEYLIGQQAKT